MRDVLTLTEWESCLSRWLLCSALLCITSQHHFIMLKRSLFISWCAFFLFLLLFSDSSIVEVTSGWECFIFVLGNNRWEQRLSLFIRQMCFKKILKISVMFWPRQYTLLTSLKYVTPRPCTFDSWLHPSGAHEIRSMLQQDISSFAEHHTVQTRLDDFYMSRIGIRMVRTYVCALHSMYAVLQQLL